MKQIATTVALGVLLGTIETNANADGSESDRRSFAASVSFGGELAWGKTSETVQGATANSAWSSSYSTERRGLGPTFELGAQGRSRSNAFGGMFSLGWLRGKTTITSGDLGANVSNAHRTMILSATGDWRLGEVSPFHAGGAVGLGALFEAGTGSGVTGLFAGSFWLGADWFLGSTNLAIGPRVRLDAAVGDGALVGGSLLLDLTYWAR